MIRVSYLSESIGPLTGHLSPTQDHLVIAYSLLFHGFAFPLYSLSLFLPTIISGLGYADWKAQLLTTPVYGVAFFSILLFAWASHRNNKRGVWIIVAGVISIVGYIVLLTTHTAGARYAGVFIAVIGICKCSLNLIAEMRPRARLLAHELITWMFGNEQIQRMVSERSQGPDREQWLTHHGDTGTCHEFNRSTPPFLALGKRLASNETSYRFGDPNFRKRAQRLARET